MINIQPTPEQIRRAKNDIYYLTRPYIDYLNNYISLKQVRLIISDTGVYFDYGEETPYEKEIKKIIEYIQSSIVNKLNSGKY
jgi:hypothetical protein